MMQSDNIDSAMKSKVREVQNAVKLQSENQSTPYSGHSSAPDGGAMQQNAAGPGAGSPGK